MKADSRYTHQHITHQSRAHSRPHTPHSLCLDPHTTLANTYDDFRVTTYNLRLTTYTHQPNSNWDSVCWGDVRSPPPVSLSSQPASQYLRLTTYDFLAFYWDSPPPAVSHSVQSLSAASQHLRRFPNYDLRLMTGPSFALLGPTQHHQQPPAVSHSVQSLVTTYNLRLPSFLLGPTHHQQSLTQFNISLRSQPASQPANTYYSIRISTKKADIPTHQHQPPPAVSQFNISIRISTKEADIPTHQHQQPLKR